MEKHTGKISVIIPAYNEELMVEKAFDTIDRLLQAASIPCEFIFIDDGSQDTTWNRIEALSKRHSHITGLHFSRNFGKESAIYAGLAAASAGGCAVIIDCDLQHPPEKIIEMYRLWQEGYEIVEGVKTSRGEETLVNALGAKAFYHLISKATNIDMRHASDFKLLDYKAVLTLLNMKERNAFFRALSSWIGFTTTQVEFSVQERELGESKWSVLSLVKYAINNVTSFSTAPMQIVTVLGCLVFCVSAVLSIIALYQKFTGQALGGFTTVIISQLFSSSVIMISLGIIGYYIAKIYDELKGRPKYIISKTCGTTPEANRFHD